MIRSSTVIGSILFLLIGCFPFLLVNTFWAELVFLEGLPEGKEMGTALSNSYNFANIGLVIYTIGQLLGGKRFERFFRDDLVIAILLVLGILSSLMLALLWDETSIVSGHEFSPFIYLGSFMSGVVGCFAMVVLFAFASQYRPTFTSWLSCGLSSSGIVTSLWSEVQLHLIPPGFPTVRLTFILAAVGHAVCGAAFLTVWLIRSPFLRRDHLPITEKDIQDTSPPIPTPPPGTGLLQTIARDYMPPILTQMVNSACIYFIMPGLLPFMASPYGKELQPLLNFIYQSTNVAGRLLGGVEVLHRLHISYYVAVYLALVVAIVSQVLLTASFDAPFIGHSEWILEAGVLATLTVINGYVGTSVYTQFSARLPAVTRARVCRATSLANQAGFAIGSIMCLLFVKAMAFFS